MTIIPHVAGTGYNGNILTASMYTMRINPSFKLSGESRIHSAIHAARHVMATIDRTRFFFDTPKHFLRTTSIVFIANRLTIVPASTNPGFNL